MIIRNNIGKTRMITPIELPKLSKMIPEIFTPSPSNLLEMANSQYEYKIFQD